MRRIPEHGPKRAGFHAVLAPDAHIGLEFHPTSLPEDESVGWADPGTGRVGTGPADDDHEPPADASRRMDVDAGPVQAPSS